LGLFFSLSWAFCATNSLAPFLVRNRNDDYLSFVGTVEYREWESLKNQSS